MENMAKTPGNTNVTPENFWEVMGQISQGKEASEWFTVKKELLVYAAMCIQEILSLREAQKEELATRLDNTYKPNADVPAHYKRLATAEDGDAWEYNGLKVIRSGETIDGKKWIHVSFSRKSRIPSYEDMIRVKRDFIGPNGRALMVLPDKKHHVNIHPFCLHLFHCEGDDGIPEFSWGGVTI